MFFDTLKDQFFIVLISFLLSLPFIIFIQYINKRKFQSKKLFTSDNTNKQLLFSQRLQTLTKNLTSASEEFDEVLIEMNQVANDRNLALTSLEKQITELTKRETDLKSKVSELEKVSLPVIDYFLQANEKNESRNAKRDYLLFIAGIIASAIVSIIMRIAFKI